MNDLAPAKLFYTTPAAANAAGVGIKAFLKAATALGIDVKTFRAKMRQVQFWTAADVASVRDFRQKAT